MDKEVLQKIYALRKVKPTEDFKERTKRNILTSHEKIGERVEEQFANILAGLKEVLQTPVSPKAGLVTTGAFALLLALTSLSFPLTPEEKTLVINVPEEEIERERTEFVLEEGEEIKEVAKTEESLTTKSASEIMKEEYPEFSQQLLEARSAVLGLQYPGLTEEEIAKEQLAEMEETKKNLEGLLTKEEENMGIMVVQEETVPEEVIREALQKTEEMIELSLEALEEKEYLKVDENLIKVRNDYLQDLEGLDI